MSRIKPLKLAICATFCVTGVSLALPANALTYSFTDLGTGRFASAINNAGQVAGYGFTSDGALHAMVWNGASVTDLGTLGGSFSMANGINDAGQIVGESLTADGSSHATLWNGTTTTDLGASGTMSSARAINNAGQVVGQAGNGPNVTVWNGTTPTDLRTSGVGGSFAGAINDAGQVVGSYRQFNTVTYQSATIWNGTTPTQLGHLPGFESNPGLGDSSANDINNAGQVVGATRAPHGSTGDLRPVRWDGITPIDLGTLGGLEGSAFAINDQGQIVGRSLGSIIDLNSFLDASAIAAGWILTGAADINAGGWIVGDATNIFTGESHAYVLSPVPEPAIYALMLAGLGMLTWVSRTRKLQERAPA